jgi:hypothetical protein
MCIIPFIFNKTDAYWLILTNEYPRIVKNDFTTEVTLSIPEGNLGWGSAEYDPNKHQVTQTGDLMFLAYNDEGEQYSPEPWVLTRTSEDNFVLTSYLVEEDELTWNFTDGDVNTTTDVISGIPSSYGLKTGTLVHLSNSGGALPTGLSPGQEYYLIKPTGSTVKFATSRANALAGTAVDITAAAGGGTHTLRVTIPLGNVNAVLRVPYDANNIEKERWLSASAATGTISIQSYSGPTSSLSPYPFFTSEDIGSFIILTYGSFDGVAKITGITSPWNVTAVVQNDNNGNPLAMLGGGAAPGTPTDNWRRAAWSNKRGFPRTVCIFEERLLWGGSGEFPEVIWGSMNKNLFHMMEKRLEQDLSSDTTNFKFSGSDVLNTDPVVWAIGNTQINRISWMIGGARSLQLGTRGGEYTVTSVNPREVDIKRQTSYGSKARQVFGIEDTTVFVDRSGKKIRDFKYVEDNGAYVSLDLSALSEDLLYHNILSTESFDDLEIKDMCYQPGKSVLWVLTTINELIGISISTQGRVIAWHTHTLGGVSDSSGNNVKILGLACLPNANGTYDDVGLIAKRYIDSSTQYYFEILGSDFEASTLTPNTGNVNDLPWFLDSAVYVNNSPASTTVSGLDHLEGETVHVLADGEYVKTFTVSSGEITLNKAASDIIVGYLYNPKLKTLKLETGGDFGVAMGSVKRYDRITVRLFNSRDFKLSVDAGPSTDVVTSGLATNDFKVLPSHTPGEGGQVTIEQDKPYPLTVLAMGIRGNVNE